MTEQIKARRKLDWRWLVGLILAGALAGYAVGGLLATNRVELWGGDPPLSVLTALFVALIILATALTVLAGLISPRMGSRFLNVEDAEELVEQRALLIASGMGMLAMTAILALLCFATTTGGPLPPAIVALGCAVFSGVVILAAVRQHGLSDELMRETARDAGHHAFTVLGGGGSLWAIAAHLEYAPGPQPLDWVTLAVVASLAGALYAAGKRGLLKPR